jgi:hypothetical protein
MHYRAMFDSEYLGAWDLKGRDVTVTIREVRSGKVKGDAGRSSAKAIIFFKGAEKGMVCNITNARTIAGLYGTDTEKWVGKKVILWPTVTEMAGETKDCIRIRPTVPTKKGEEIGETTAPPAAALADDPLGDDDEAKPAGEPS